MTKRNVPELRLAGFDGEWVDGQLANHLDCSALDNSSLSFGRNEVYAVSLTQGLVNQVKFHGRSFAGRDLTHYDVVLTNDVVYTKSPLKEAPFGIIKTNSSSPGIVSPLYAIYHPKSNTAPLFVQAYFALHHRLNSYLSPLVNRGAKNTMNITDQYALSGSVTFPKKAEQEAIGAVFSDLDAVIEKHEQRHRALQQTKSALMQRMFPQEGETEPRLRLEGHSGEWHKKTVGSVAKIHNGRDYKHLKTGSIPVYGTGGYMCSVDQALSYETDAIGIGRKGTIDKPFKLVAPFWTVDTLFYVVPQNSTDLDFFYVSMIQIDWMSKNTATGLPSLTSGAISTAAFMLPPTLAEQEAIGAVFSKLDGLIEAEAKLVEKLKQTKTALLQKMFV